MGAIALLIPGFPRLKEWAYAGIFFDVSAAVVSVLAVGDGVGPAPLPFAFVLLTLTSWALRPASRVMHGSAAKGAAGTELTVPASAAA